MKKMALTGRTLLLVHAGSVRKKFILERLKELGVTLVCLHKEKMLLAEPYIEHWITADLSSAETCLEQVNAFLVRHSEIRIEGVITFWDECTVLTSRISEELHLAGIPFPSAEKIKNKYLFRDLCQEYGIPAPRHKLLRRKEDIAAVESELRFPLVVKPVYGASSAFVVKVENRQELEEAFASIEKNIHMHELAPEWRTWDIFLEEYIDGDEVDIDILLQQGEMRYAAITDNNKTNEPFFVETGEGAPSQLSAERQKALIDMAHKTLKSFGVTNGCFHFEAKSTPQGVAVPIEINMRMGGGDVYVFSQLVWGVDLIENAAKIALNMPIRVKKPPKPLAYLAAQQFLSDRSGVVTELMVDERLKKKAYVVELYFQKKVGDTFLAPPEGYDSCVGWLTVRGSSMQEAKKHLAEGMGYVTFTIEKDQRG